MSISVADGSRGRATGLALLALIGGSTLLAHVAHAMGPVEGALAFATGILLPLLCSVAILAATAALCRRDTPGTYCLRVGLWCLVTGVGTGLVGALMILYQHSHGLLMVDRGYVLLGSATVGAAIGTVIGAYDGRRLTTMVRLDEERRKTERLHRRLRVLNRVLRHDIRNDVNVIRGYAALLLAEGSGDSERLEVIADRATGLARTGEYARRIEQLVAEEGNATQGGDGDALGCVDLAALAADAAVSLGRDYPEATVRTSLPKHERVVGNALVPAAVANVVENAVRHNDRDAPQVDIAIETTAETATLTVADDGPGIPSDEVDLVSRGDETPLRHSSGLGLWLAAWAVEEADGTVAFEENEPRGSIVSMTLARAE